MGSVLKETLMSLCCSNGWSYGVFWRFDQRNNMLLTMEDAYYEEEMGAVVNNMLLQTHMLGEGLVGQAALSGKYQWISSDANSGGSNSAGSVGSKDTYQDDSEIHCQFSSGLKSIAVIPVESRGVVQFGSTKEILETPEFLDQTIRLFSEMENVNGLTSQSSPSSSLNYENCDLNEWFASFCNANITPMHGGSSSELMEIAYSSINLTQSSGFSSDFQQDNMNPLCLDSSQLTNQLQTAGTEAQVILSSNPNTHFHQLSSQYAFSVEKSAAKTPCISTWSNEGSILTSLDSRLPSEIGVQDSPNVFSIKEDTPDFCRHTKQDFQGNSTVTSLYSTGGLINVEKTSQENSGRSMNNWHSSSSYHAREGGFPERETNLQKFPEEFKLDDFATDLSTCFVTDNIFEWFASPSEYGISKMAATLNENLSQPSGVTSVSSGLVGDVLLDIPFTQPANSVQSSITDTYVCGGEQKPIIVNDARNNLFEGLGLEYECGEAGDSQENMVKPVVSVGHLATSTGVSECISELDVNSTVAPRKGLFSELGLEELLNGSNTSSYITNSSIDDQFSTAKRRRLETSSLNQVHCSGNSMTVQPAYHTDKANNLLSKKEVFPKSQVGLWIDDSYIINNGGSALAKSKKPEEPTKATRKRARPGESTRPRPKDRQQIQDRIKELKGIIPDGGKCSIDALLDRTIKYMLFLQSVTKYADKLKQADEPKLIAEENKTVQKDNGKSGGGATWALEVGDQSMVCPIIVEDLSPPGLMLIEMLCDDRGFFLEIADVIRGFGLNILKGVMETREDKIWARFIVEANTHITRIDIFWSLVQLLQLTSTNGMDSTNQPNNVMNGKVPLLNNYQQPALPCSISVAEAFQ